MEEIEKKKEFLFEENEENIVIKYKLLRSMIIKHYNRGCRFLEIAKVFVAVFFLIFTAVGVAACAHGSDKSIWLVLWIIIIFTDVNIFLITDYCKYLLKSKVIPYLEDDNQIEFGEYSIFSDDEDDEEDEEDDDEYEREENEIKKEKKRQKKQKKLQHRQDKLRKKEYRLEESLQKLNDTDESEGK